MVLSEKEVRFGWHVLEETVDWLNSKYDVKNHDSVKVIIGMLKEYKFHLAHHLLGQNFPTTDLDFVENVVERRLILTGINKMKPLGWECSLISDIMDGKTHEVYVINCFDWREFNEFQISKLVGARSVMPLLNSIDLRKLLSLWRKPSFGILPYLGEVK